MRRTCLAFHSTPERGHAEPAWAPARMIGATTDAVLVALAAAFCLRRDWARLEHGRLADNVGPWP